MTPDLTRSLARPAGGIFAVATLVLGFALTGPAAAESPFASLSGNWVGTGNVTYDTGATEALKCKVTYDRNNDQASEDSVLQNLTCASDSYKFHINAYFRNQAGMLTGHWDELVLNISGSITGTVSDGNITGALHGPTFLASVHVDTTGDQQTVTISSADKQIRQVSVSVRRRGG